MMSALDHLEKLYSANIISALELEFVRFLKQVSYDESEKVLMAAAACVYAQRQGHVCLDFSDWDDQYLFEDPRSEIKITALLKKEWRQALEQSALVASGDGLQPLVLDESRLYLHRYWKYEDELCSWLQQKAGSTFDLSDSKEKAIREVLPPVSDLFELNWQHVAVQLSFLKDLVIISGGPGTGKTFTVLNIIAAQAKAHSKEELRIALSAPTGKAARRLSESIKRGKSDFSSDLLTDIHIPDSAMTVHKLLGSDFRGNTFRFNEENPLPYEIIVVDEASMLDINLWVRLIRAVGPHTKLIVLGDKDQLASVEAGSILGDICGGENSFSAKISKSMQKTLGFQLPVSEKTMPINDCMVFLTKSYRFDEHSGIQKFASAVNKGDADTAISVLRDPQAKGISWIEPDSNAMDMIYNQFVLHHYQEYISQSKEHRLSASNNKKVLCALRKGPFGVEQLNERAERIIRRSMKALDNREWYDGRIVMATKNDSLLKIRNGEIGIFDENNDSIVFEGEQKLEVSAARLKDYEPAFAITIHKSQGSEFDEVAIILSNQENSILSKEILYTAVTRARKNTLIIVTEDILRKTIERNVNRKSGVKQKIWGS